jgi:uncharacterized protein
VFLLVLRRVRTSVLLALIAGLFLLGSAKIPALLRAQWTTEQRAAVQRQAAEQKRISEHGNFHSVTALRAKELSQTLTRPAFFLGATTSFLALLLLGVCVGRSGILHNVAAYGRLLRRLCAGFLLTGVIGTALYASWKLEATAPLAWRMAYNLLGLLSCVFQGLGYAAGVALLTQHVRWRAHLAYLAPAGRMTLTNFMLQGLVLRSLFDRFFLHLKLGPAAGLSIAIAVLGLQLIGSALWLQHKHTGPLEHVWRYLSYGPRQRRVALAQAEAA